MKKNLLLLLASSMLLGACTGNSQESSSPNQASSSSEAISSEESSSEESSSSQELHIDTRLVGTWYINSSTTGTLPINGIFTVNADDTLEIGERTLTLSGHYETYEETYKFVYGSISFIISYDEDHDYADYAYQNTNESDLGYAAKTPVQSSKYDYEGDTFPMTQSKEYLETSLDLPTFTATSYAVQLYTSPLYEVKCADIVCFGATLATTSAYLQTLLDDNYELSYKSGTISEQTFYTGHDSAKTYSLRVIFYKGDTAAENEAHIFLYNYNEKIA